MWYNKITKNNFIKMKTKTKVLTLALSMLTFCLGNFVHAQNVPVAPRQDPAAKAITVATVNLYNAKLESQDQNKLQISFDISNREGIQPGVKYAVQLVQRTDKIQNLIDTKVYDEVVSLGANETIHKNITYLAPEFLSGKYMVNIEARNSQALPLGMISVGEFTFAGNNQYIGIDSSSCYLTIDKDIKPTKYNLTQGVDIAQDETLQAHCNVINNFKNKITITPVFATYARSIFGKIISSEKQTPVDLNSNQKMNITLAIPKTTEPQAYDAILTLQDAQGKIISSPIDFHYVLHGASATIQNIRLDKDVYQVGDQAKLSFYWSGSADSFPNSRLGKTDIGQTSVNIEMKDDQGNACTDSFIAQIQEGSTQDFTLAVNKDCRNPQILVSLADSNGNVLAKDNFNVTTKDLSEKKGIVQDVVNNQNSAKTSLIFRIIIILIAILVFATIIWLIIKKGRQEGKLFIFIFLLLGGMLVANGEARADTVYVGNYQFTIQMDKQTYSPGEVMNIRGGFWYTACQNNVSDYYSDLGADVDGQNYNPIYIGHQLSPGVTISKQVNAPTTLGLHSTNFYALVGAYGGGGVPAAKTSSIGLTTIGNILFTVVGDGICGSYNNQPAGTIPPATVDLGLYTCSTYPNKYDTQDSCNSTCIQTANCTHSAPVCPIGNYACNTTNIGFRITTTCTGTEELACYTRSTNTSTYLGKTIPNWECPIFIAGSGTLLGCSGTPRSCINPDVTAECSAVAITCPFGNQYACIASSNGFTALPETCTRQQACVPANITKSNPVLCAQGTPSLVTGSNPQVWTCAGTTGYATATCQTQVTTPVDGICGSSNGQTNVASAPTTNLCGPNNTASPVPVTDAGLTYAWNCTGLNGGTTVPCSASKPVILNGACGSAANSNVTAAPVTNLCSIGIASAVTGSGPWSWTCSGVNGGNPASCSAPHDLNWREVSPN